MTRLVASMMVGPGEVERYLPVTVNALLEFCDQVVIADESVDAWEYLRGCDRKYVIVTPLAVGAFFAHEGQARQALLEQTLAVSPDWILAIDADELVADGKQLRAVLGTVCPVVTLRLEEVWKADADGLRIREDGGWRPHNAPVCYRVPTVLDETWRIQDRALACGREPLAVRALVRQGCWEVSGTSLLHLGWTNEAERAQRHQRYVEADGGRFHAAAHLRSIMDPDSAVKLVRREWPPGLVSRKAELLERVNR